MEEQEKLNEQENFNEGNQEIPDMPEEENMNPKDSASKEIPAELNQPQALQVLIEAARIAQSKGVFTLDDAELVNKAIRAFIPQGPIQSK